MALDGKTAAVTGAARGIGYAYCRRLAADGAHVVAVDIDDPVDAVRELTGGGDKLGLMCDINEPSQVDAVTSTVLDRYGRCDILVNNAGIFLNTGSGITLTQNRDLAYMTSKGTVHVLTRALANELGDSGITVNAIAPGLVATMGFLGRARPGGPTIDEVFTRVTALQTIKRQSVAADLGNALGFLVSDDADFITGQILHVDGGMTRTGA
ncbi:SDR family NAD(P)-dependent oxidoreductase [Streptomyces misionensis]|uniref:SDR family NAD(P)-dependent oxidoreductase n=1 Tax=Streptomyces misionensis TaxID=67331 RepID=UPI0033F9BCB7